MFNFTGSILTRSFGTGIVIDDTTILKGALTSLSPFFNVELERKARASNAHFDANYRRISRNYWADQLPDLVTIWKKGTMHDSVRLIALRLCIEAKDPIVRADMLRMLGVSGISKEDYLSFLVGVCQSQTDPLMLSAAINTLSNLFNNKPIVLNVVRKLVDHSSRGVQMSAFECIFRSKSYPQVAKEFSSKYLTQECPEVRRVFADVFASTGGKFDGKIVGASTLKNGLLYNEIITSSDVIATANIFVGSDIQAVASLVLRITKILLAIQRGGMPLIIDESVFAQARLNPNPCFEPID